MDLRSGIFASAQALGVSPYDLATAISYETAGTFDPLKRGPTTQWGQHRGLIQFGEPQAQEYGVNWDDPIGSQLGPEGAVVKYLKKTGVKPGMGLLDIYSAINAGGVGRYGASDANNGGAPGTVRDKVEKQMSGHRDKAMALLGSEGAAPPQQQPAQEKPTMQGILGMIGGGQPQQRQQYSGMGDPRFWNDLAGAFATMSGNPDLIQSVQMTQARQEQKDQRNSTTDYLRSIGRDDLADAFQNGMIGAEQLYSAMQPAQPDLVEINGQLVDKRTGQVMGDYRTPEDSSRPLVNAGDGRIYDPNSGEWIVSPDSGKTDLPDSILALQWRAQEAGLKPGTPEYAQFMVDGGNRNGMAIDVGADGTVSIREGAGAGTAAKPFTEAQSKDITYATRAEGALKTLEPVAGSLTSRGDIALEGVPFGFGRGVQNETYQVAKNAGDDFLMSILRKDTGAAITNEEQRMYGDTYLPRPGDSAAVLEAKSTARKRALDALKAGMSPSAILAQETALGGTSQPANSATAPAVDVSDDDLLKKYGG